MEAELRFDRAALVTELRRLSAEAPIEPNGYLSHELRLAADSLDVIGGGGDRLGRLFRLRLLAEVAIRLRWVAGDEDATDGRGRPIADRATAMARIGRIVKRDLLRLAQAQAAIHEVTGGAAEEAG